MHRRRRDLRWHKPWTVTGACLLGMSLLGGLLAGLPGSAAAAPSSPGSTTAAPHPTSASAASAIRAGARPPSFGAVHARPGPKPGQITFTWSHSGKDTTSYRLETALTRFSKTRRAGLPTRGRHARTIAISRTKRSLTLSAAQVARAGAPLGSGSHLYFRFFAINTRGKGTAVRAYPHLQAVTPRATAPKAKGLKITIGSFNVRSAKAAGNRPWLARRHDVARAIVGRGPLVVGLQELGPGRADGRPGRTTGSVRQTQSLLDTLRTVGGSRYALVRTTPYVMPYRSSGTQGARILYDRTRLRLTSVCPESTKGRYYSSSCSVRLPLLSSDSENARRHAAYASFKHLATGKHFFVVSAHLDARHSAKAAKERRYNALRGRQVRSILAALERANRHDYPVIFTGDLNSWQGIAVGNSPHDTLVSRGFYDTAAALTTANLRYSTANHFATTQPASVHGFASRLDVIMVKGARGAASFENVTRVTDTRRPSDHNLVVARTTL